MVVPCAHFEIVDSAFFGINLDENSILVPESCYVNHHSSETAWFEEKILDGGQTISITNNDYTNPLKMF
jgi:hypothetical protein